MGQTGVKRSADDVPKPSDGAPHQGPASKAMPVGMFRERQLSDAFYSTSGTMFQSLRWLPLLGYFTRGFPSRLFRSGLARRL